MEKQGRRSRRLVLVPCPFQGHINPMLQLGTILHSKGFSITVAHPQFNSPDASKHPGFTFLPLLDGSSEPSDDSLAFTLDLSLTLRTPLQEILTYIIEKQEQHEQPPCIIYDGFMHFAEEVASDLNLPSINLRTGNATNYLMFFAYPRLQEDGYIPLRDSKLMEFVPGFHPFRFKDLAVATFKNFDTVLQLVAITLNRGPSLSAMICNTMDFLEQSTLAQLQEVCQVPIFSIGPMHKMGPASSSSLLEEDTSCISWLEKQTHNSVIYVSLGSAVSVDQKELEEMAWGLANSNQPFLWVIRPGSVRGSESTDSLPEAFKVSVGERGCIVKWAPQRQVLAHSAVGGFWTHCGWNSTVESISEGVPMICRPFFGDQRINARYVSHVWKVGLELENDMEREEIERAIRRLMVEKEGEEMRQRALDLKVKSELCVQRGGSSYNNLNELVELIMSI